MELILIHKEDFTKPVPIDIKVVDKSIGLEIKLSDYLELLKKEIGTPMTIWTSSALSDKIDKASREVIEAVKLKTSEIM